MMHRLIRGLAVTAMAVVLPSALLAAQFDVGRAEFEFPSGEWREVALPDKGLEYAGDRPGNLGSETKLLVKESPNNGVEAVVLLRGSKGGVGGAYMTYSGTCNTDNASYAEGNSGQTLKLLHCLRVFPAYATGSLLASLGEATQKAMQGSETTRLPKAMSLIISTYGSANGTFMHAVVLLSPQFAGLPGEGEEALPEGVERTNVTWGRALNKVVRDSVLSFSGHVTFPPMDFTPVKEDPAGSQPGLNQQ